MGRHFGVSFKLTPIELEITKSIVIGQSLIDLAKARSRSIGTVRNQTKALLSKLNVRSQTELSCLYSGFSKFHSEAYAGTTHNSSLRQFSYEPDVFLIEQDRLMNYEIHGHSKGRPVLFFPALLGGAAITKLMHEALLKNKIKLIVAWRPYFANSSSNGPSGRDAISRHAIDCIALLDYLKIDKASVIGQVTSVMYALAMGKEHPERVESITCVNGVVPNMRGKHLKRLTRRERFVHFLTRHAPTIGRLMMYRLMTSIDSGFDEEIMKDLFAQSPRDIETTSNVEIKSLFRNAFTISTQQSYEGFVQEFQNFASDWHDLFSDMPLPITWFIGEGNPDYDIECIQIFLKTAVDGNIADLRIQTIPNTAHLALYQNPHHIFQSIAE